MGVSHTVVAAHLKLLGMVKKLDKWVPHDFTEQQQLNRLDVSSSLLRRNDVETFLHRIVTCDEKWILYDNRKRSAQWVGVDEPPKNFHKPSLHATKTMITVWWSNHGLIHYAFPPQAQTMTTQSYCD